MNISKTIRFAGRDIVVVGLGEKRQAMYKSSGENSGKPGQFLPFDGIMGGYWFHKYAYANRDEDGNRTRLHRYGTEEIYEVSQKLAEMEVSEGEEVTWQEVNEFIQTEGASLWK